MNSQPLKMSLSNAELDAYWDATHEQSGWLNWPIDNLTPDNVDYLVKIDDYWTGLTRNGNTREQNICKFVNEMRAESGEWVNNRRKEYLMHKSETLKLAIRNIYSNYANMMLENMNPQERIFYLVFSEVKGMEKNLDKIGKDLKRLNSPIQGGITDDDIAAARLVPLEQVLDEKPKKGFIHCPIHRERLGKEDKNPSMKVFKGCSGHCYSCKGNLTALDYLIKVKGMRFVEAVKNLIGG